MDEQIQYDFSKSVRSGIKSGIAALRKMNGIIAELNSVEESLKEVLGKKFGKSIKVWAKPLTETREGRELEMIAGHYCRTVEDENVLHTIYEVGGKYARTKRRFLIFQLIMDCSKAYPCRIVTPYTERYAFNKRDLIREIKDALKNNMIAVVGATDDTYPDESIANPY